MMHPTNLTSRTNGKETHAHRVTSVRFRWKDFRITRDLFIVEIAIPLFCCCATENLSHVMTIELNLYLYLYIIYNTYIIYNKIYVVCMYRHTYSKSMDQSGKAASPARS